MRRNSVLVSGASFAGLGTAFWMRRAGYDVTVVETARTLREGGTPVNIKAHTVDVARRMGLFDQIVSNRISFIATELWGPSGMIDRSEMSSTPTQEPACSEYEIERDTLTNLMFNLVKDDVEFIFDDTIVELQDNGDRVDVAFAKAGSRSFSLVFGCDGIHSNVRSRWFGNEGTYLHFLKTIGSVTIVPRLLIEDNSLAVFQAPGRSVILSAYNGKTDIITLFSSDDRIDANFDRAGKVAMLRGKLEGSEWRIAEFLNEIEQADNLYFGELAQIKMGDWTKGRVGLVGDAAYCPSAAAGMGGSLAIDGAAALGKAISESGNNHEAAFCSYNKIFRPFVEQVQDAAASFCKEVARGDIVGGTGSNPDVIS